jgi:hypothetical protein
MKVPVEIRIYRWIEGEDGVLGFGHEAALNNID